MTKGGDQGAKGLDGLSNDDDRDDVPIYVWRVSDDGVAHALASGSPRLPATIVVGRLAHTESVGRSIVSIQRSSIPKRVARRGREPR